MDKRTKLVKKTICPSCGAAKATAAQYAYVYCDYCGGYMDFDMQSALRFTGQMYDEKYSADCEKFHKARERAKAAGDKKAFIKIGRGLYGLQMEKSPHAWSVRIGDPSYRATLIENQSQVDALMAFDADLAHIYDVKLVEAYNGLKSAMTPSGLKYSSASAWNYFRVNYEGLVETMKKRSTWDVPIVHPDETDPRIMIKGWASAFLQGWMPYLFDAAKQQIIEYAGLESEYLKAKLPDASQRTCGKCGGPITAPPGSRQLVCEGCGYTIDVESAELPCPGCSAVLSIPVTADALSCPHCGTRYRDSGSGGHTVTYNGKTMDILDAMIVDIQRAKPPK